MAGPIQLGDVINFSKLAWDVYRFGWENDFNATWFSHPPDKCDARQYAEFGREVKGLADNLDILGRVVYQAGQSLRQEASFSPRELRWDQPSLIEIIGDYKSTLNECEELIKNNYRYRISSGPLRNIEWNVLVAPAADRLRQKIALHNSKVFYVLKPFEIDLLCRVREDINRVHQDLAQRIQAVHVDLHHLIGVLVPSLERELAQQAQRQVHTLDLPPEIEDGFRRAWTSNRAEDDAGPSLQEMADAFVLHFEKSTVNFTNVGILVENRIPSLEQYLSLLKCVWLMRHIRDAPQLGQPGSGGSHWPSYVDELENASPHGLSKQCGRFTEELVKPRLHPTNLTMELLEIWPERELPQLVDVVTRDALMEQVLDAPLKGSGGNVQKRVELLRRMGADGRRFRVNFLGVDQGTVRATRRKAETIDFDITSVILTPLYAVPSSPGDLGLVLRKDERTANLAFTRLKDVFKFQQAVTGFRAFHDYIQYNAVVNVIISGREPLIEEACVQLWTPKHMAGQLVTNNEAKVRENANTRSSSVASSAQDSSSRQQSTLRGIWTDPFPRSSAETVSQWNTTTTSPTSFSPRSPTNPLNPPASNQPGVRSPVPIPYRPGRSGTTQTSSSYYSSSSSSPPGPTTLPSPSSPLSSSLFPGSWQSTAARSPSASTVNSRPDRTFSVSSNVSTTTTTSPSNTTTSSGASDAHTVTVSIGGGNNTTTGTVHRRPPKPMLVLFTQNPETKRLALMTVDIDEDTDINPDRCNCRRSGRSGASCEIASVEQKRGAVELSARRFESREGGGGDDADWNLARLALGRRGKDEYAAAALKDVRRISILFPTAKERARFGGTPSECQCKLRTADELTRCLKAWHKGYLGMVREVGRQNSRGYHQARFERQQDVVWGMRDD